MRTAIIILGLLIISGCETPAYTPPVSHFDLAIENLSITTEQLESVRREKDFFVRVLEDFEQQKTEYGHLLDARGLHRQIRDMGEWHRDISRRERAIEVQHALNVLAARNQLAKRKYLDPNQPAFVVLSPDNP
jgi:hypothetical protein